MSEEKEKPKKRGRGRPPFNLDTELIRDLAGILCTNEEIAAICKCSKDLLETKYSAIIKEGRENGRCSLRRHLWGLALGGHAGVSIWLSKQHLGMREPNNPPANSGLLPELQKEKVIIVLPSNGREKNEEEEKKKEGAIEAEYAEVKTDKPSTGSAN